MEWISCLKETLRYLEDNLRTEVDIGSVAKHVYVSQYHLQRGFQIVTGCTVGEYVRNRRLYEAARELTETDARILDVALRWGYDTPESFTKAFTRFHGLTPSQLRADPSRIRRFLPMQIHIEVTGGSKMNYVVSPLFPMKLIGFQREFGYETAYAEIPRFWDEICEKYCTGIYAGKPAANPCEQAIIDNCIGEYGVCIDDLGGGRFRYLIAGKYTGGGVPEGMTLVELPGGEWAKFKAVGRMPEALQAVNTYVFKEWLPGNAEYELAGDYNVEWYSCDGDKDQPDYESAVWIPVKRK